MSGTAQVGAPTAGSALKRRGVSWLTIGGIVACLAALCVGAVLLFAPTKSVAASVEDVYWQTTVPLQEVRAVDYSDEPGDPPSEAYNVYCQVDTKQVCEDKTIDKGNGYAEVVTECHDERQQYCSYTLDQWQTIQEFSLDGHDYNPQYAQPRIVSGQRIGDSNATLTVYLIGEDGSVYEYHAGSEYEFQQFTVGSSWTLHLNALGAVVSVD